MRGQDYSVWLKHLFYHRSSNLGKNPFCNILGCQSNCLFLAVKETQESRAFTTFKLLNRFITNEWETARHLSPWEVISVSEELGIGVEW